MIVLKFGGTSVQDAAAITNVVHIIEREVHRKPLVVVSACAGVTDALIMIAKTAEVGKLDEAERQIESLLRRHLGIAEELMQGAKTEDLKSAATSDNVREMRRFLTSSFAELTTIVKEIAIVEELSPRVLDQVLSFGEQWSSYLLSRSLEKHGVRVSLVDATSLLATDDHFNNAEPQFDVTTQQCTACLLPLLQDGKVVVTQGFIGSTDEGETTTIGRGGSDYSASIFGARLNAEEIQIWTDTNGILTADPFLVSEARSLESLGYEEAEELALRGAKVLHPSTVAPALEKHIPLRVLNSKNPTHRGTLVVDSRRKGEKLSGVKSVTLKCSVTLLRCKSLDGRITHSSLGKMLNVFKHHGHYIDIVTAGLSNVSFVFQGELEKESLAELEENGIRIGLETGKAIVSVIGFNIRFANEIVGRILEVSADNGVTIDLLSHGSSDHSLPVVVEDARALDLLKALHEEFFERQGVQKHIPIVMNF